MIDHVGFEVADLDASAEFYDAVFFALGGRRTFDTEHAIAWGRNGPELWVTQRSAPAPGYGHLALKARGRRAVEAAHAAGLVSGGTCAGPPGSRPQYGARTYSAYLHDPDGLRVEVVSR